MDVATKRKRMLAAYDSGLFPTPEAVDMAVAQLKQIFEAFGVQPVETRTNGTWIAVSTSGIPAEIFKAIEALGFEMRLHSFWAQIKLV